MTIGTRDSRKIIGKSWDLELLWTDLRYFTGKYNLTSEDVRSQAKFDDTIGVFPEFIGTSMKILQQDRTFFKVKLYSEE